jgi:hypothetical protein
MDIMHLRYQQDVDNEKAASGSPETASKTFPFRHLITSDQENAPQHGKAGKTAFDAQPI